jgi:hypothetical protein
VAQGRAGSLSQAVGRVFPGRQTSQDQLASVRARAAAAAAAALLTRGKVLLLITDYDQSRSNASADSTDWSVGGRAHSGPSDIASSAGRI